jgi:hypothetical protein
MSGTLVGLDAFLLDDDYLPGPRLTFSGGQAQSGVNPGPDALCIP